MCIQKQYDIIFNILKAKLAGGSPIREWPGHIYVLTV